MKDIKKVGLKDSKNKLKYDLIYPECIKALAEVLTYGANKYTANSWQNVEDPINTHYSALMRHLIAWKCGDIIDQESKLSHLKHVLANTMFLLYHEERYINK